VIAEAVSVRESPAVGTDGPRFAEFCRRFIRHSKGRWYGQPLELEDFQRRFFDELFAYDADGMRLYKEALWLLPRKNGKSVGASAFSLYMLLADGEAGPEVYCAASTKDQARIVFDQASSFVRASPDIQRVLAVYRGEIRTKDKSGFYKVLSSEGSRHHGYNSSANVIDEVWAHEDPELYTALTSGSGARLQPLTLSISTVGWNRDTVLGRMMDAAMSKRHLIEKEPGLTIIRDYAGKFLLWWHHSPEDADPADMELVRLANPAPWITEEYLKEELHKPTMRVADFMRLHMNLWTNTEADWLPRGTWERCREPGIELDPDLPVSVGIDIALTHDYCAVVCAQQDGERIKVIPRFWFNPWEPGHPQHDLWELDLSEVRDHLRSLFERYPRSASFKPDTRVPAPGPAFLYDPWKFRESAQMLAGEGLMMLEMPQWDRHMVPACTEFYELCVSERVAHDGDHMLAEHVANARGVARDRGWRIRKPKDAKGHEMDDKHIDGAIAAAMAVWHAAQEKPKSRRQSMKGF
jgi:phage terminase large subunit-like protein